MQFNHPNQKNLRQQLRNQSPLPEKFLWEQLRQKRLGGYKFRRQYGIGHYVVDFYCPAKRLVVELDGSQHAQKKAIEYDKSRTTYFETFNIKVIRFWNNEVFSDVENVCEVILRELESS